MTASELGEYVSIRLASVFRVCKGLYIKFPSRLMRMAHNPCHHVKVMVHFRAVDNWRLSLVCAKQRCCMHEVYASRYHHQVARIGLIFPFCRLYPPDNTLQKSGTFVNLPGYSSQVYALTVDKPHRRSTALACNVSRCNASPSTSRSIESVGSAGCGDLAIDLAS